MQKGMRVARGKGGIADHVRQIVTGAGACVIVLDALQWRVAL